MKNNFLDVLIGQLESMKNEGEQPSVGKVISVVIRTAVDQKLSFDTKRDLLECLMAVDGITPDEAKLLRELDNAKENKA